MKQFSKDLGNVSLAPKGRWSKEQEYERLNLVYNACDNLSYVAKIDVPIGVEIDNREYWQPMNATGYADNNFINLTTESETGTVTAYESLEEAVATILPINRRAGATLSFYNLNSDRLDRQAEFELWQFNSTDLANWENRDYWNNIYYNWNVFAGWYVGADGLKNHVKIPNVGQYAYVGTNLNDALLYQCRTNGTWTNTGIKVRNYISVVVSGNITIGENGNWFSDGKDTGIPATPAVDEQLDNIIMQLQQHTTEINNLKASDANLQDQITSNDSDITNLTNKHESLSRTVQGIAATGGASTATNVTYNNDSSGLNAENAQDAIDELTAKNETKAEKAEVTAELEKKFDKESILQESGEAEDKVMSQKAVSTKLSEINNTTNKNVFSANAEINDFIRECYIENWNGGDLYFDTINTNDDGKVSIFIRTLENNWFIAIYKQPFEDFYIKEQDGTKLYIAVDKNVEINYNSKGSRTNVNKVSSRAFSLINSPMIKEKYFIDTNAKINDLNNTTNKNVFSGNAEINAFIKECYIENWNGGDLYFDTINTNDDGKVSIYIQNLENENILVLYKQPLKDIYIGANNGVKAYFVVDTKISITYSALNTKTDRNKISSKAFSLINSPIIKEKYFTDHATENTNIASDIASTQLSWKNFIYYKMSNRTNLLTSWKNELFCKLEQFIVSLKVSYKYIDDKEKVEKYLSHLYLRDFHLAEDGLWFNLNNKNESLEPSLQWILYNIHLCDKKEEGIQSYTVTYNDYTITVIVNWNYYFEETDPSAFDKSGNIEIINYLDKTATSNSSIVNIENVLPNLCSSDNSLTNKSFSKFEISNGKLNIVASGNTGTYTASRNDFNIPLKAGHKYNVAYKILFKDKVLLYHGDVLSFIFWAQRDNDVKDAYTCDLRQPEDIKPATQELVNVNSSFVAEADGNITTIELRKYNNTKTTDKILDVEISYIMLLDSTELGIDNYQLREILLQKDSFFTDIQIFKYYPTHQLYYNMKLRSLGDSLPETVSFQPWIANELGMKYSTEFELNTKQIEYNGQSVTSYRSTWGSTRVAPVISSSTNERFMANASIYMRAKSLKYDMPDVLIILAGYNDPKAGSPYIDSGTYVQPEDYGINDAPYTGDEIDLVSDKTQTAPSFGASYRGMLEQIIKDNPRCRIILCGVPRGSGEANKFGKENDWNEGKNKVIEKIAKEYGYPFVNLADLYGVNKFNYEYLTKDNLHFSNFGGRRVAMEILAKAF